MKTKTIKLLAMVFAGSLASFSAAIAEGWFVRASGGIHALMDQDFDTGAGGVGPVETEFDQGGVFIFAAGKASGSLRIEGEVALRMNDVDSHAAGGMELPGSVGESTSMAYMLNLIYSFEEQAGDFPVIPYVGAGIGIAAVEFDSYTVAGVPEVLDDEDAGPAYQLIAGLEYGLSEYLDLTAEFRFFSVQDLEVDTTLGSNQDDIVYEGANFLVGFNYGF